MNQHSLAPAVAILCLGLSLAGCGGHLASSAHSAAPPPAKVENAPHEGDLAQVTLTPQAVDRLGITIDRIERKPVARRRTFPGEVVVPVGSSLIISAPVAGTIAAPSGGNVAFPGSRVSPGQALLVFVPLLSPERFVPTPAERVQMANARASLAASQVIADGDVERSKAEVAAAEIALARAKELLSERAISAKAVDDAQAQVNIAKKTLEAALSRKILLDKLTLDSEAGDVEPLEITAPSAGIVRTLSVAPGQTVATGAPLLEIVDLNKVWIRVRAFVGLAREIDAQADAIIGGMVRDGTVEARHARPIAAPPSADPISATVDLYYEMDNAEGDLRPGQRVDATLALAGPTDRLVIPWAAVVHDIYGGTWVYEQAGETVFRRRRVAVEFTDGQTAVLASGPGEGTPIVVDGVAELFGTEFGAGK